MVQGTGLTGPQARDLLGRFLFSGEQVEKPVEVLSGGERRRLALARVVVSGANFLVLDEPTNHLDIESREALEDALTEYSGTVLLVSHDRALIEALATRTIAIEDGRLRLREGAFGEYARDHEPAVDRPKKRRARSRSRSRSPPQARPSQRSAARGGPHRAADPVARGGAGRDRGPALPARRLRRSRRAVRGRPAPPLAAGGARAPVPRVGAARRLKNRGLTPFFHDLLPSVTETVPPPRQRSCTLSPAACPARTATSWSAEVTAEPSTAVIDVAVLQPGVVGGRAGGDLADLRAGRIRGVGQLHAQVGVRRLAARDQLRRPPP